MRPAIDEAVEFSGMNKTTFINGDIMEKINKGGNVDGRHREDT